MTDNEIFALDMLKVCELAEYMGIDITQDYAWELAQEINEDASIPPTERKQAVRSWLQEREFVKMFLAGKFMDE